MCGPNIYVVFRAKKNFQELQLHQTLIFFSEFWHPMSVLHSFSIKNIFMIKWTSGFFILIWRYQDHSIFNKSLFAIFQKIVGFNFICVFSKIHYD